MSRRTVTASFVDSPLSSDIGVVLVTRIDRYHRVTERLAVALSDGRDSVKVQHTIDDLSRQRSYQIACGYEDAADANTLRYDAGFQIALDVRLAAPSTCDAASRSLPQAHRPKSPP